MQNNEIEILTVALRKAAFNMKWQSGKYRDVDEAQAAADHWIERELARGRRQA